MTPKIHIRDICLNYAGRKHAPPVSVLDRISLDVADGEFICLVGPSGCGKSTLLNVLGGFLRPDSGAACIDGQPVSGPDPRRIFIFQECAVFPWMTVAENIGFGLPDRSEADRRAIIARYVELIGLAGFENFYPHQLSGGMKQRVELARALAANPDVLFMDEPFGALDFLTRLKMRAELVRLWRRERKTIVFVTHDVEEAVQLADRVVVLGPRPATIRRVIDVDLPRPRDLDAPGYLELRDEIFATLGLDHTGLAAERQPSAE